MAVAAAELMVAINASTDGLQKGLGRAESSLKTAGRRMRSAGKTLTTAVTAPIAAIGVGAVKAFADFDQAMTESLSIMSDVTDTQKNEMTQAAKQVARETTLSAEQAAESYFYLASAGLDAEESISALPEVANLAQAGAFDMATATDLATDSMTAMGLETEDLTRVTDVMTKANEIANTSVEQFGKALTNQAGPALRNVGKSIEEGGAVLATFADQGIKAEKAGVLLRQSIDALTSSYGKNKQSFERLGIELFDSEGKMRNMADITEDFEDALGGMSDKARSAAFQQLGLTVKVRSGIQALMGNSSAMREYQKELENAGGTTERVAEKQMQSFSNQLELAKQNIVNLGIELGENLAPLIERAASFVGDLAAKWEGMSESTQDTILAVAGVAAAIGPLLYVVGAATSALGTLSAGFATIAAAAGPIAAFAAAAYLVIENWEEVSDFLSGFIEPIKTTIRDGLSAIETLWQDNKDVVLGVVDTLITDIGSILESIANVVLPVLEGALGRLKTAWDNWGDNIVAAVGTAFNTIVGLIEAAGDIFVGAFQILESIINPSWEGIWEGIKTFVGGIFDGIVTLIGGAATTILNALEAAFEWLPVIGPKISDARDAVKGFIDQRTKDKVDSDMVTVKTSVETAMGDAASAVGTESGNVKDDWDSLNKKAKDVFGTDGSGGTATDAVVKGSNAAADAMSEMGRVAAEDLTADFEAAGPAFATIESKAKSFQDQLEDDQKALNDTAVSSEEMAETVENSVKTLGTGGKSSQAVEFFKGKIDDATKAISDGFNGAIKDSVKALLEGENAFTAAINTAKRALINLVSEGIADVITKLVKEGASSLVGAIGDAVGALSGGGNGGGSSLSSAASTAQTALAGSGGSGGLLGSIAGATGAIGGMLAGLEGVSRLMGQSFFGGMIEGWKNLGEAIRNAGEEFQGFGGDEPRGGRTPGSGNFSGNSVAYALSQIPGVTKMEASQIAPQFVGNPVASVVSQVSDLGGGIPYDQWFQEAVNRVQQGAPALAKGGLVFGPTLSMTGEYPGARSNPEMVAPADKMMGYIERAVQKAGGSKDIVLKLYMDGREMTRQVIRNIDSESKAMGVRI